MKTTSVRIQNYKILRDTTIVPLGRMTCLVGENNSGKSAFLQALDLFYSGGKPKDSVFFSVDNEIRIEIEFSEITPEDLARIDHEEHRTRIESIVVGGTISLVRTCRAGETSTLRYRGLRPTEQKYSSEFINANITPPRSKPPQIREALLRYFPEREADIPASPGQGAARDLIDQWAESVPRDQCSMQDIDLPTGVDTSIYPLLPEPIYIPAVKDFSEDVKTIQSATFGKILSILSGLIEPNIGDLREHFSELNRNLNIVVRDGEAFDERQQAIREVETLLNSIVSRNFPGTVTRLQFEKPELRTILAGAQILVDDGLEGLVDTKGDGLRRSVVFAILRAYSELESRRQRRNAAVLPQYMLLFEEPELYLYPEAQKQLFHSLRVFSESHTVVASTHSPAFLHADATEVFIKMRRHEDINLQRRHGSIVRHVNLRQQEARDRFQIMCYENNSSGFFSRKIVLVEGDSDLMVLPHLARIVADNWAQTGRGIDFLQVRGKGSFRRYKNFFRSFDVPVIIVSDIDILVGDFDKLDPDQALIDERSGLLQAVDALANLNQDPTGDQLRDGRRRATVRVKWERCQDAYRQFAATRTNEDWGNLEGSVAEFFSFNADSIRTDVLRQSRDANVVRMKECLLDRLRREGVIVWARGAIEDYYPQNVVGEDKSSMARSFCELIRTREQALGCCDVLHTMDGTRASELQLIVDRMIAD